eukprot:scaffold289585_cov17-Tisochrysis_lutea.AAC.1
MELGLKTCSCPGTLGSACLTSMAWVEQEQTGYTNCWGTTLLSTISSHQACQGECQVYHRNGKYELCAGPQMKARSQSTRATFVSRCKCINLLCDHETSSNLTFWSNYPAALSARSNSLHTWAPILGRADLENMLNKSSQWNGQVQRLPGFHFCNVFGLIDANA